ncbi:phage tail spike protein [Streptococcus peroris]|uniref:phage tail spike protein n=1 Tax=Streptococcus peroris TaxID=68891 RepID=UPI0039C306A7
MIYLSDGNIPLNAAYDDNITQEANSTYQLTFRFPTNNILWQKLREEAFLTADDLHGEQDFVIFEVEKHHGYIQVYANQVMTLLNNYVIGPLALDRVSGSTALSQFAGSITRENPFSFFSDIDDRHTFNTDSINAMTALTKDKHSILGQWGGDLVRHGYQVRLLKNGGSENESLFMYKKNLSSYKQKTSTKSLKTRITFKKTIKSSSENNDERKIAVVVDSPLINKYSQIYEDIVEVNDQDVKDEASLREYGKQYFRTTLCDMLEDSIEIDVVGQSDVPVQMFDIVGVYHEYYDLDVRKKITKYNYSPMAKKLKSIGFGQFQSGLASAIGNAVSDAVKSATQRLDGIFEAKLAKEIQNADLAFDRKKEELTNQFTDEVNVIKAKAEENKQALSDEINRRFHDFSPTGFEEAKAKAEEALKKAGATADLAGEAKRIADENSVIFAGLADKVNKQEDKLTSAVTDLKRYSREETQSQIAAVRETIANGFVARSTYLENVEGINQRFESLSLGISGNLLKNSNEGFYNQHDKRYRLVETLQANQTYTLVTKYSNGENSTGHTFFDGIDWRGLNYNQAINAWMVQFTPRQEIPAGTEIILSSHPYDGKGNMSWATLVRGAIPLIHWQPAKGDVEQKLAEYKETVDGRFATISSQIAGKVDRVDFQRVKETSQLYERILGSNDSNVASNIARMALTSELFEVEVGKRFSNLTNLFYAPTKIPKYISSVATDTHLERVSWGDHDGIRINYTDSMSGWLGVRFPLTKKFVKQGESLGYRIEIAVDKVPRDGRIFIQLLDNTTSLGMYYNSQITLTKTGNQVFTGYLDIPYTGELNEYSLRFTLTSPGNIVIHKPMIVDKRIIPNEFIDSTDYNNEYNRVTMSLMKDSFAIKSLNSAGDIIAGINVGANGNNRIVGKATHITGETLIDNAVIKSAMIDKLKTANFEAGSVTTTILGAGSVTADKVLMDTAMANKFVASDVFTNTLAAKTAFINKLRSVVVSATLLEGYKGKIGGFQIGTHDKDPNVYWLTGQNQFAVGMSNGSSAWGQAALWVNWGTDWGKSGPYAWYVLRTGEMYCKNDASFYKKVDFANESSVNFYGNINYYKEPKFFNGLNMWDSEIIGGGSNPKGGNNAVVWWNQIGSGSVKYWIDKSSDRRLKENITQTAVNALDRIDNLDMVEFDFIKDKKHEEIGLIAQEVERIIPQAISRNPDNPDDYLHIDYTALVPYLIKAIQELNKKVERLETT